MSASFQSNCVAAILAGGRAERFGGQAKGLLDVGGTRIIDRVHAELRTAHFDTILVANADDANEWLPGVLVVPDSRVGCGPLAGLEAALIAANGRDVLLVAWDMPFLSAGMLSCLRDQRADVDAVVPGERDGHHQPLCARYAARVLPIVTTLLDSGRLAMHELIAGLNTSFVSFDHLAEFGEPDIMFLNVNDADDLAWARAMASAPMSAPGAR